MLGQGALRVVPPTAAEPGKPPVPILVQVALDGPSGDPGQRGDLVVGEVVALEPEDIHLALDAGIGVMVPVVGQRLPVLGSEGEGTNDKCPEAVPGSFPVRSLRSCAAADNLCQVRPSRVYLSVQDV